MPLKSQLMEDMKNAMRARDSVRLNTIRFLMSDIKNFEIDNGEQDDAGIQKIIARQVKQMKDAINDFAQGGRQDLVEEETGKVKILEEYLPQQMSDEDLKTIVDRVVGSATDKNMGMLMGQVMKEVAGQADGGRVSAMLKQALQA
jgi:uncharacterized protein YqeY